MFSLIFFLYFPGTITFHVRAKPTDFYPRKRKKKPGMKDMQSADSAALLNQQQQKQLEALPFFFEVNQDGSEISSSAGTQHPPPPQKFIISLNVTEVGTDPAIQNGQCLLLPQAPYLFPRHCVLAHTEGIVTITPSHREAETFVNNQSCLLYTSPSPRDRQKSRMPSSA